MFSPASKVKIKIGQCIKRIVIWGHHDAEIAAPKEDAAVSARDRVVRYYRYTAFRDTTSTSCL